MYADALLLLLLALQVEVFKALAQRVSWLSAFDSWYFDCMDWTPMIDDLGSGKQSLCDKQQLLADVKQSTMLLLEVVTVPQAEARAGQPATGL